MSEDRNSLRAHLAATVRHHPNDVESINQLRRNLAAKRLADYIKATVDAAGPLSAAQRDELALLLRGEPVDAA